MTTKIQIIPYLAEYLIGKYNNGSPEAVKFPDESDIYHSIWQLMTRRPKQMSFVDAGNLEIFLPERRVGKDPKVYNYLSETSISMLEKKIKKEFNEELHSLINDNVERGKPYDNIEVIHQFMCAYCIESISEDALIKNYYRWKENIRKLRTRREYKKKLNFSEKITDRMPYFVR